MTQSRAWKLTVGGFVQGVGYRAFVRGKAECFNVTGYVKNEDDGTVTVLVQGNEDEIQTFIEEIKKPPYPAKVSYIKKEEVMPDNGLKGFTVVYH